MSHKGLWQCGTCGKEITANQDFQIGGNGSHHIACLFPEKERDDRWHKFDIGGEDCLKGDEKDWELGGGKTELFVEGRFGGEKGRRN